MNLIDYKIIEVLSVKPAPYEWVKEFEEDILEVKMIVFGEHGHKETIEVCSKEQWEEVKKKGYITR